MKNAKVGNLMDQKALIMKELAEGIELAKQLRIRMLNSSSNNNHTCLRDEQALNYSLVDKMLSSFDKSISLAKLFNFDNGVSQVDHSNSPECSLGISSPSPEVSSQDLRVSKKRKKMPPRIEMVPVSPNKTVSGLEGPLNDGLSWRKYGQKDILGAKFPRSYYRCTHRYTQSCVATKQVQKSDEDPNIYQVIYKGQHTCITGAHLAQAHNKPDPTRIETELQPQPKSLPSPQQECQTAQQEISLGPGPKVEVEPIEKENLAQIFRSFSFKSAQFEPGLIDEYMVSSSPGFWLPATSESDCFLDSACRISAFGLGMNVQTSESDVNESISGPSSVANSPNVGDFEFNFDMLPDIDCNFSFDFDPLSYRM